MDQDDSSPTDEGAFTPSERKRQGKKSTKSERNAHPKDLDVYWLAFLILNSRDVVQYVGLFARVLGVEFGSELVDS